MRMTRFHSMRDCSCHLRRYRNETDVALSLKSGIHVLKFGYLPIDMNRSPCTHALQVLPFLLTCLELYGHRSFLSLQLCWQQSMDAERGFKCWLRCFWLLSTHVTHRREMRVYALLVMSILDGDCPGAPFAVVMRDCKRIFSNVRLTVSLERRAVAYERFTHRQVYAFKGHKGLVSTPCRFPRPLLCPLIASSFSAVR